MYFAGIDIGSTMTKVVIYNGGEVTHLIGPTGPEHRRLANRVMEEALNKKGISLDEVEYIVATGYGRINVPFAEKQVTEITCHAKGVWSLIPEARTIIDIGGQDSKAIRINETGKIISFAMNDKCAAGTGRFLEVISEALGIPLNSIGEVSLKAERSTPIGNTCTVFAEQEVISSLASGEKVENLISGIHDAIAARIYALSNKIKIEREIVITGGGAKNIGLIKALEKRFKTTILVPPEPLITGALGAAIIGKEICESSFAKGEIIKRKRRGLSEATFY
ncbi:MAG: acyl-CoA dehydratase activase [Syntrophorhabdaceae bacterium]|nr:acyl-CoA dehydratase activase [Syntrophorhabdaceae bacterium]